MIYHYYTTVRAGKFYFLSFSGNATSIQKLKATSKIRLPCDENFIISDYSSENLFKNNFNGTLLPSCSSKLGHSFFIAGNLSKILF